MTMRNRRVRADELEPFWRSTTLRGESLLFVDDGHGAATARLLFDGVEQLTLTSATGDIAFEHGRDFVVDPAAGVVSLPPGSRIPCAAARELSPDTEPFVLIGDGDEFHRRQTAATYVHRAGAWTGAVPRSAVLELPATSARLSIAQPLTIGVTGDSISEGYNASGITGAPPFQRPYVELVAAELERRCGSRVTLRNFAVSGWTADDGAADLERLAAARPDLVIVAYGMNDSGYADARHFAANVTTIVDGVRAASPGAEFVLVSPMLPNPRWAYPVFERFAAYRDALAAMCGPGIALADLTTLWRDLLRRKSVHDLTGNGINHPNDFGHRLYAQVILSLFTQG
jgi:acyl-CoA thioesterase I